MIGVRRVNNGWGNTSILCIARKFNGNAVCGDYGGDRITLF